MTPGIIYGAIPADALALDEAELAARLKVRREDIASLSPRFEASLRKVITPRYVGLRTPLSFPEKGKVDLGFTTLESHSLAACLAGCKEALVFAVTLGHGVDRLLRRAALSSVAEEYTEDAYASALAEAAVEYAEATLAEGRQTTARFSPGYGDLALTAQSPILEALDAKRHLSLTLTASLLMIPSKSVTAICGLR